MLAGKRIKSLLKPFSLLVLVFVLVAIAWLLYMRAHKTSEPYKYTYQTVDSYVVPGAVSGAGISFKKPVELTELSKTAAQAELQHIVDPNHKRGFAAYVASASTTEASAYTPDQLSALKTNLAFPDTNYSKVVSPINQFLKDRLPLDWQIKLETAKPFTNANIKDNAWMFNFSVSDPNKKKTPIYGEVLYVISGKNYYYFMVSSVSYNWQPNQKVWQQVVDSLKINQ